MNAGGRAGSNQNRYRALKNGGKVYLGPDDLVDEEDEDLEVVRLNVKAYDANSPHVHAFYTEKRPDVLFTHLLEKLEIQPTKVSNKSWKMYFNVRERVNEGEESEAIFQEASVRVEITKLADEEKYCLDFRRQTGESLAFFKTVQRYIDVCNE